LLGVALLVGGELTTTYANVSPLLSNADVTPAIVGTAQVTPKPTLLPDYGQMQPATPEVTPSGFMDWKDTLGLLAKLGVVVLVIYGSLWALRVVLFQRRPLTGQSTFVQVRESIPLAPNRMLYLVELGSKMLLLGATEQQISLLGEVNKGELASTPFVNHLHQQGEGVEAVPVSGPGAGPLAWARVRFRRYLLQTQAANWPVSKRRSSETP